MNYVNSLQPVMSYTFLAVDTYRFAPAAAMPKPTPSKLDLSMKTVRDACQLQDNALSIKLSDQVEQLDELITSEGDGTEFFARTAITQGMQDLISEGIARLAGASTRPSSI